VPPGTPPLEKTLPEMREAPGADKASLRAVSVEVDGASPSHTMMWEVCFGIG
jgi:hypothetical protein